MKQFSFILFVAFQLLSLNAQEHIYRHPDVSQDQIVFSYANDLWLVPKKGGQAIRLSSPPGPEMYPRFSPDGQTIAFSGNYDGNIDIYTLPIQGGLPHRLTHHGMADRMVAWHPSGDSILLASSMHSGKQRYNQFFMVSKEGSLPRILPMEHAEYGTLSPDGSKIAFTYKSRLSRTWKRYQGGMAADIFIFNLQTYESENITNSDFNDELPMWHENTIYYLSDQGSNRRFNIWAYDIVSKEHQQITDFSEFDVHFPEIGPEEIVFEAGGSLYLLHLDTQEYEKVHITITDDYALARPHLSKVKDLLQNVGASPDGNRILAEARGEIFSLPAEKGIVENLTQRPGSAERNPSWSPDGKKWAYWSDQTGEYQLYITEFGTGKTEVLTHFDNGFGYQLSWSPDSKKLAFIRQDMKIYWIDIGEKKMHYVDQGKYMFEGSLRGFQIHWSPDSRYMTYHRDLYRRQEAIFIYDTQKMQQHQVTSGYYSCSQPSFSSDGKFLVLRTDRRFSPTYSSFDNSWVYVNSSQLAILPLHDDVSSPFLAVNDTVELEKEKDKKNESDEKSEKEKEENTDSTKRDEKTVDIQWENLERKLLILPLKPGNLSRPGMVDNKVFYLRHPSAGQEGGSTLLQYFDLKEQEEIEVISGVQFYEFSANNKKILTGTAGRMGYIQPAKGQKLEKTIPLDEMQMWVNPREEWKQIFDEVWRIERDFFYDPGMHGVDWDELKVRYGSLVNGVHSREDLNYLIGELIGELNASHTYRGGGATEDGKNTQVGYLGVDWVYENGGFRIKQIVRPAQWETEVRSPLDEPGLNVKEGDYVISVNGVPLSDFSNPFAAFAGLAGKTVALRVSDNPQGNQARTIYVKTMESEVRLRNLAWIEKNRKYVEEASEGRLGYIYVPSTGLDGQEELVRMFYGQIEKEGLIVDERFNNGGQIPDRFIEILNRPILAYWDVRDGETWTWPPTAHFGPKAMLINGWSGSGGDAFPDYFRKSGLGPLIGTKTWGGLIGLTGGPTLVDGGSVTAPTFRMFNPDGTWFPEGHGVEPDIHIPEDPSALARGIDPQLDAAIEYLMKELRDNPGNRNGIPQPPPPEKRN